MESSGVIPSTAPVKAPAGVFTRWLRNLSASSRFYIIVAVVIFILLVEVANAWFVTKTMSGIRVFVSTQEAWSLAQKDIYKDLVAYADTRDPFYYEHIEKSLRFYYGDRNAKLEMEKPNMDYAVVSREFISADVHPSDVNDTVFVFRTFRNIYYVADAIKIWDDADVLVQKNIEIRAALQEIFFNPAASDDALAQADEATKIADLRAQADEVDNELTNMATRYTEALGYASRTTKNILILATIILSFLLGVFAILIAVIIQRIATRLENDKKEFITLATHQLNTPLSIMKNAYAMVKDGSITIEQGSEYWGNGMKRMVQVLEDIRDVLQFEGQKKYDIKENDIIEAMKMHIEDAKKLIATTKKDIKVIVPTPTFSVPKVLCDITQLNIAIHNLLDNAVVYTPSGSISIVYELIDDKYLRVSIKDTGIGFSKEEKEGIGQKFYRSQKAMLARADGSGLGVYICKNVIEKNKGKLLYESEGHDKGATFSFSLPIAK